MNNNKMPVGATHKINYRQSTLDIACQEYGRAEVFFDIILQNGINDITEDIQGKEIVLPDAKKDKVVLKKIENKKIVTL